MKHIANKVTETEDKLTLPNKTTNKGSNFTIEGIDYIVINDE